MTEDLKTAIGRAIALRQMVENGQEPSDSVPRLGGLTYGDMAGCEDGLAQAALQAIHDAGYVVVPREPTEAMIDVLENYPDLASGQDVYRGLIQASQPKTEVA